MAAWRRRKVLLLLRRLLVLRLLVLLLLLLLLLVCRRVRSEAHTVHTGQSTHHIQPCRAALFQSAGVCWCML